MSVAQAIGGSSFAAQMANGAAGVRPGYLLRRQRRQVDVSGNNGDLEIFDTTNIATGRTALPLWGPGNGWWELVQVRIHAARYRVVTNVDSVVHFKVFGRKAEEFFADGLVVADAPSVGPDGTLGLDQYTELDKEFSTADDQLGANTGFWTYLTHRLDTDIVTDVYQIDYDPPYTSTPLVACTANVQGGTPLPIWYSMHAAFARHYAAIPYIDFFWRQNQATLVAP